MIRISSLGIKQLVVLLFLSLTYQPTFAQILLATDFVDDTMASQDVSSMVISPDGRHMYTYSQRVGILASFNIDQETGGLEIFDTQNFTPAVFAISPAKLNITADGKFIYAEFRQSTGGFNSTLSNISFVRDPLTGMLDLISENFANIPDGVISGNILISPDSHHLYLVTFTLQQGVRILAFEIAADGTLLPLQTTPLEGSSFFPFALSPDGRHLYTTGTRELPYFLRNSNDGTLTLLGDLNPPGNLFNLNFSNDGRLAFSSFGLPVTPPSTVFFAYDRDPESGRFSMTHGVTSAIGDAPFSSQELPLFNNNRLFIRLSPLAVIRFFTSSNSSFELPNQVVDTLSTGTLGRNTSSVISADERFYYRGISDGITVFRINAAGIGDVPSVPSSSTISMTVLSLVLLMAGALAFRTKQEKP